MNRVNRLFNLNRNKRSLISLVLLMGIGLIAKGEDAVTAPKGSSPETSQAEHARVSTIEAIWERNITDNARNRYCDKATGEDIGWLMAPFLGAYYYGYLATGDMKWLDRETDWLDSWVKRQVIEPDGYPGWPKVGAAGTPVDGLDSYNADSLLGEAMALRYAVLSSSLILKNPSLTKKYGRQAQSYLALSEKVFEKWDKRGAWRKSKGGGMISVVLPFGIDLQTGQWTSGYPTRNLPGQGFSHPVNKANLTALWLLAMFDATHKPVYRDRAEKWFWLLKSRMKLNADGTYAIWNYWQPAGLWDYKADGSPKLWVGVHPNGSYYEIDLEAIVEAYRHGLIFGPKDIARLIATAHAEKRFWRALMPYDASIRKEFAESLEPGSWDGITSAPLFLWEQKPSGIQ
jgi:hypothetical protein